MDSETLNKIEVTVREILKDSNMDEMTENKVRKSASEKLEMDLSEPTRKKLVREVVESYLRELQAKEEEEERRQEEVQEEEERRQEEVQEEEERRQEEVQEEEEEGRKAKGGKEYDDEGGLIICRLSDKRRVTLSEFRGKTLVSIREFYKRDGKELPSAKGISLTAEQWASFSKNVPAIEKAIKKMESR